MKMKWNREEGKEPIQVQSELATTVENWCRTQLGSFVKCEKNESQNCLFRAQRETHLSIVSCCPVVKSSPVCIKLPHIF